MLVAGILPRPNTMDKNTFVTSLADRNFFWSYQKGQDIPDPVVIEQVLLQGEVPDLKLLFRMFDNALVRRVWEEKILPQRRYRKINYYLGTFFFDIDDIRKLLNKRADDHPRLDRLQKLAAPDR